MKKTIMSLIAIIGTAALMTSCSNKDFQCNCTYIADVLGPNAGKPNKTESTNVQGRLKEQADIECLGLQAKYMAEFYSGTCIIN